MSNPLGQYLKRNGITPHRFALAAGIPSPTINRIVNGRRGVGMRMAAAIEKATAGAVPATVWLRRAA